MKAPYNKLVSCHVWWSLFDGEVRYKVFDLSGYLRRPLVSRIKRPNGLESLMIINHPVKFGGHKHCSSGGTKFSICNMISRDCITNKTSDFIRIIPILYLLK